MLRMAAGVPWVRAWRSMWCHLLSRRGGTGDLGPSGSCKLRDEVECPSWHSPGCHGPVRHAGINEVKSSACLRLIPFLEGDGFGPQSLATCRLLWPSQTCQLAVPACRAEEGGVVSDQHTGYCDTWQGPLGPWGHGVSSLFGGPPTVAQRTHFLEQF